MDQTYYQVLRFAAPSDNHNSINMNHAYFQVLGFGVPSGPFIFHDEGYVSSIPDKSSELNKLYGLTDKKLDEAEEKEIIGRFYKAGKMLHIFYLKRPTRSLNIQNRSHEETHALEFMGQLNILADRLLEEQRVMINFNEIDEMEVRAQLGSLYALNGRFWANKRLRLLYKNDSFEIAKKIYRQSKQPKKSFFLF